MFIHSCPVKRRGPTINWAQQTRCVFIRCAPTVVIILFHKSAAILLVIYTRFYEAASEFTALAVARSARLPILQCWRALPTAVYVAVAAAKVDSSDTAWVKFMSNIDWCLWFGEPIHHAKGQRTRQGWWTAKLDLHILIDESWWPICKVVSLSVSTHFLTILWKYANVQTY